MTTPHRCFAAAVLALLFASPNAPLAARRIPVEFSPSESQLTPATATLTLKQAQRVERALTALFPVYAMRRLEHTREAPAIRRATYNVIDQDGSRFVLVGFTGRWSDPKYSPVNVFAVYRLEDGMPNQVWRSKAWEANYYRLAIQTAQIGKRNVVLFQEGGTPGEFALASVFTFANAKNGIAVNDLTPSLPWLWARTHFPFRPLYGEGIGLKMDGKDLVLTASDATYEVGRVSASHLERSWKYIPKRNRFEHARERRTKPSRLTQANEAHVGD